MKQYINDIPFILLRNFQIFQKSFAVWSNFLKLHFIINILLLLIIYNYLKYIFYKSQH